MSTSISTMDKRVSGSTVIPALTRSPPEYSFNSSQMTEIAYDQDYGPVDEYLEQILYGRIIVVVCVLGIIGNLLNMVVLSQKSVSHTMERMEKSVHVGLFALAASDLFICVSMLPMAKVNMSALFHMRVFDAYYAAYSPAITNTFILSSTWLIVAMATSRYLAICHPLRARMVVGMSPTRISIACIFVLCVLFTLPQYWLNTVDYFVDQQQNMPIYIILDGYFNSSSNGGISMAYTCFYVSMGTFIPFLFLVFCNASLIRSLRLSVTEGPVRASGTPVNRTAGARRVTLTLVVIVIMYLLLAIPAEVTKFLQALPASRDVRRSYNLCVAVVNTLQVINFAFNFVLYCAVNTHFRRCLASWLRCRSPRGSQSARRLYTCSQTPAPSRSSTYATTVYAAGNRQGFRESMRLIQTDSCKFAEVHRPSTTRLRIGDGDRL